MSGFSPKTFRAAGTIRRARFVNIYASANNQVEEADANELPIGVAQDGGRAAPIPSETADPPQAALAGEDLSVHTLGMHCLLEIGSGGCNPGDLLKSDADGKGVVIASTGTTVQNYGAIAEEAASDGELCKVQVLIGKHRPALT